MRITNNILINNLKSNMRTNIRNLEKYQRQLASGQRINKPSDDPVGLVSVLRLSSRLRDNEQYKANVNDAMSWLTATESSLSVLTENVNRVHELTVYGATGTLTYDDRKALSAEVRKIREQIVDLINTTHGDRYVFGGTNTTRKPYDGSNWNDNTERIYYEIGMSVKVPVNLTAQQVFKNSATLETGATAISGVMISGTSGTSVVDGASITISAADNTGLSASARLDAQSAGTLTIQDASAGSDSNDISVEIITNSADSLAVTSTGGKITIALANSTGDLNSAAAIEAAVQALGTVNGVDVSDWTVTADALWDSGPPTTANVAETSMAGGADANAAETIVTFNDGTNSVKVIVADTATSVSGTGPFAGLNFSTTNVTAAAGTVSIEGTDILSALDNIILHLETDAPSLNGDIAIMNGVLNQVLTCTAELGARMNHLELTGQRLLEQELNFKTLLSETGDIDPAEVILELTNQENVYSSALAVGARIIMPTLMDFLR